MSDNPYRTPVEPPDNNAELLEPELDYVSRFRYYERDLATMGIYRQTLADCLSAVKLEAVKLNARTHIHVSGRQNKYSMEWLEKLTVDDLKYFSDKPKHPVSNTVKYRTDGTVSDFLIVLVIVTILFLFFGITVVFLCTHL